MINTLSSKSIQTEKAKFSKFNRTREDKNQTFRNIGKILVFFDHLPPCVDIFYGMNVAKKWTFKDDLPTFSCKPSL